jgi:hypothetical protein
MSLDVLGGPQPAFFSKGKCRTDKIDPNIFYPEESTAAASAMAKAYCGACSVRIECLNYALDHDEIHGVWGGKSERERNKMTKTSNRPVVYCSQGHPQTEENKYRAYGLSQCRVCASERAAQRKEDRDQFRQRKSGAA